MRSPRNHKPSCSCYDSHASGWLDRRHFLQMSAAALAAGFSFAARAENGPIEAMLLICTDPRIGQPTVNFMNAQEMAGKYRPFAIEGGAIGLVAEQFRNSPLRKQFWDDLDSAVAFSQLQSIIALDHRDCDAAKTAYGLAKTSDHLLETEMHRYALTEFRNRVAARHADVDVKIGLMALNGKVQMFR